MFSKALFKQTMKANWVKWVAVTVATCVMLAIVIIVLGNLGINDIRDSLSDVFTQADQEAYLKDNAVDMYELYLTTAETNDQMTTFSGVGSTFINNLVSDFDNALTDYETENNAKPDEEAVKQIASEKVDAFIVQYESLIEMFMPDVNIEDLKILLNNVLLAHNENASLTGKDLLMEGYYITVYDNAYALAIEEEKTEADALSEASEAKEQARKIVVELGTIGTQEDYSDYATTYVNTEMYNMVYDMQIEEGATETEAKQYAVSVKVISNTAINTYQLWLEEGETAEKAKAEATKSISDQIPEKLP